MAETGEPWVSGGQHVVKSARAANVYRLGVRSSTSISRLTRPICSWDAKGPAPEGLGRFDLRQDGGARRTRTGRYSLAAYTAEAARVGPPLPSWTIRVAAIQNSVVPACEE